MKLRLVLLMVAAGLVLCASAQATPVFHVYAEYEASYPVEDLWEWDSPLSYDLLTDPDSSSPTDFQHFKLMLTTTGATTTPDESLRGLLLNINMGPGLTPATYVEEEVEYGMYFGNMTQVDPPGGKPLGGVWSDNSDGGDDPMDLQRIVIISVADAAYPNTLDPGEAAPYMLGDFYLNYDRAEAPILPDGSDITVSVNVPDLSVTYWSGTTNVLGTDANFAAGDTVTVPGREEVVENTPPVADDAFIDCTDGDPGFNVMHQFTATDVEDGNTAPPLVWSNLTFLGGPGGPGDSAMTATGLFTWNRYGAPVGLYSWSALVTDTGGLTDTALLEILVPEPSTIVLFGLAMVGLVGLIRRR